MDLGNYKKIVFNNIINTLHCIMNIMKKVKFQKLLNVNLKHNIVFGTFCKMSKFSVPRPSFLEVSFFCY